MVTYKLLKSMCMWHTVGFELDPESFWVVMYVWASVPVKLKTMLV